MAGKLKIVVSDLHIGAGTFFSGSPLDDFLDDDSFVRLLEAIKVESQRERKEVEFIINGDLFDFLQVPAVEVYDPGLAYPAQAYRDSSPDASVKRLDLVVTNHPQVFAALADFMRPQNPTRRVTIIKGNHDVNLYWPQVKARLREAMGATGARSSLLLFAEEFINRENIYVEHGHQRTEKINRFPDFRHPLDPNDPARLYYPPGSEFIINYLNRAERQARWLDNVEPQTGLVWYALKWDFNLGLKLLAGFIRYMPGLLTGSFALDGEQSLEAFVAQLDDESQRQDMARRYAADPGYRQHLHRRIRRILAAAAPPDPFYPAAAGADDDPLQIARAEVAAMQNVLKAGAEELVAAGKAQVVLFGHTHHVAFEKLDAGGYYINTGSWLWKEDLSQATEQTWFNLFNHPETFVKSRRLPYARIDYDQDGNALPQLKDHSGQGFDWEAKPKSFWQRVLEWIFKLFGAA